MDAGLSIDLSLSGPEGFAAKITDVVLYVSYTAIKGV